MVSDTIGDFIIRLKNAGAVGKKEVAVPYSKLRHAIAANQLVADSIRRADRQGKRVRKTWAIT